MATRQVVHPGVAKPNKNKTKQTPGGAETKQNKIKERIKKGDFVLFKIGTPEPNNFVLFGYCTS